MNHGNVNDSSLTELVRTPTSGLGFGWGVWWDMGRALVAGSGLIWRLLVRDLSARYRQSVLGYIWAVLPAVVTVFVFTVVQNARLLPIEETDIPYPVFVLLGMTVWQFFSTGLSVTTQSLVGAGALVSKVNFFKEALVFAAFGQAVIEFFIRLPLVIIVCMWFHVSPAWTVVFVPFVLIPLALLTLGFGFLLSLANAIFRDIGNALTLVLSYAMFLTPVVYPPSTEWPYVLMNYLNPVSPFIVAVRDLTTKGVASQPGILFVACILGFAFFLIGWRLFQLMMPRIAERM